MLVCISPAKKLDWSADFPPAISTPEFDKDALALTKTAQGLSIKALQKLMHLSDNLARLNHGRFASYTPTPTADAVRPAAFAFAGDTYQGLEFATLDADAQRYCQDHLRILSGLYGVLRPMDAIQAYRLEMGSRLKTSRGVTLYAFWGAKIAEALNAQGAAMGATILVNCASKEYFSAVDQKALTLDVMTPEFYEIKDGKAKMVSFYAKKARGAMARFIMQNRIHQAEGLHDFDLGGYTYRPDMTQDALCPVFARSVLN